MAHRLSYNGRDEAAGCSFRISISPEEGQKLNVDVHCRFSLPREAGLIPHSDHDMNGWRLQDPGSISALRGSLTRWLDGEGIPLTARNDTLRLLFDSMSSGEAIGEVVIGIGMYYEAEGVLVEAVERSMREYSLRPTPASRDSVEALERVVIRGAEREVSCSVCFEEFSIGLGAVKMPCSHVFHGDCIVRWLEVQRFCPLCRYVLC